MIMAFADIFAIRSKEQTNLEFIQRMNMINSPGPGKYTK